MPDDDGEHVVKCHQCKPKLVMYFDTEKEAKDFAFRHQLKSSIENPGSVPHAPRFGFINRKHVDD